MVFLATAATVIASQAVISGAFSVTQQAVQLGFLPRLTIRHTSEHADRPDLRAGDQRGPVRDRAGDRDRVRLVDRARLRLRRGGHRHVHPRHDPVPRGRAAAVAQAQAADRRWAPSSSSRSTWHFFAANLTKVAHGGWLPLTIALVVFALVITWYQGREIVNANRGASGRAARGLHRAARRAGARPSARSPASAVFLSPNLQARRLPCCANVEHNQVLHDHVIIVAVETERAPRVADSERIVPGTKILYSGATGDPLRPARGEHHSAHRALRLPRGAGRARRACASPPSRVSSKAKPDLEQPPTSSRRSRSRATDAPGMAPLAQEALRRDGAQRRRSSRLLQAARQPDDHDQRADPTLTGGE